MKFTNGHWESREGVDIHCAKQVYRYEIEDGELVLYCPVKKITSRLDTLGGYILTIKLSSPMPNMLRVQAYHFKGKKETIPKSDLFINSSFNATIEDEEDFLLFKTGELTVRISKGEVFFIEFLGGSKKLTEITYSGYCTTSYIEDTNTDKKYMRELLSLSVGENIYGLGERFTPFVKNGQAVDIWNEDGGTSSDIAYKNIPFYISDRGYGVFVNHFENVSFEIASEKVTKAQISVEGEALDYCIINGNTNDTKMNCMQKTVSLYTDLTGKPPLVPLWSYGLWLSTSFLTNYDEKTITHFVDGFKERDLPLSVFHFDCFWMKGCNWCDFIWDDEVFPNPAAMLDNLHKKGLKVCVWINPYIAQQSYMFDEGMENGYFLLKQNGDVWQCDKWQPGMAIVDFTNPAAAEWYNNKLSELLDMGVDCFKTDFGERIPTDVIYHDGSDPFKMHNHYAYIYNKVVFELLEKRFSENNAVLFARAAHTGAQKFPVHWGGDCFSTYESMAESLRGGLSLALCGFGYWSTDIGGFETISDADADIYKRWIAFGMLTTHSRLHGSKEYKVPWTYDEEAVDVLRFFTKLKESLMPYILKHADITAETGVPVMRPMVMEFPNDPACSHLDRQYMLGSSLLVAPVFSRDGQVSYYLPDGEWVNFFTKENVAGGKWFFEKHDYFTLPLYIKDGGENSELLFV